MCVIIHQKPGFLLPYNMFENAVLNNPHGYGIVLKADKRLQVIKKLPEKYNDPQEMYKILEENKDIERYVHTRFKTIGEINEQNVQPFTVFSSDTRQVVFMHNGTMSGVHYPTVHDTDLLEAGVNPQSSDSYKFAMGKLLPFLSRVRGENGPGDIHDPYIIEILEKFWPGSNNRGILISSDQESLIFSANQWQIVKIPNTEDAFIASNNDYFSSLKRGPVYDERKKQQEDLLAKEREKNLRGWRENNGEVQGGERINSLKRVDSTPFQRRWGISKEIKDLFEGIDIYDPAIFLKAFNALELGEVEKMFSEHTTDSAILIMQMAGMIEGLLEENSESKSESEETVVEETAHS